VNRSRPRVLWIPHTPWEHCQAQRPWVLVDKLRERFDIHVVSWASRRQEGSSRWGFYLNPANHLRGVRTRSDLSSDPPVHVAPVLLPVAEVVTRRYPPQWAIAPGQLLLRRYLRRLHRRWGFDAMVVCPSHRLTGFPPRLPGVPQLFDYLDLFPDPVEAGYVRLADRVVTVSHTLAARVRERYGRDATVVPNGIHLDRLRAADPGKARARWKLSGKRVVSLIGLTCSSRLYFLDALAALLPEFPDLVFVGVGTGRVADRIVARGRELGLPVVMTGWVDPREVADLFAATDVGLYPGDDIEYFDAACPIKVLEYLASGVPVVTNRTAELVRLNFRPVVIRPATVEAFIDGLREALTRPPEPAPDMSGYEWATLAAAFGDELDALIKSRAGLAGPRGAEVS
jgi:glycosyltransferase involved in cell wall biosynthesis